MTGAASCLRPSGGTDRVRQLIRDGLQLEAELDLIGARQKYQVPPLPSLLSLSAGVAEGFQYAPALNWGI